MGEPDRGFNVERRRLFAAGRSALARVALAQLPPR
jgi:hypothetical protein